MRTIRTRGATRMLACVGVVAAACGVPEAPIECPDRTVCDLRAGGVCAVAPSGKHWCTYFDPQCPSTNRWGPYAGDGLADECVAGGPPDAGPDATFDTTPPATTITGMPSAISGPNVTFMFQSNEPGTFECSLDGSAFALCASPKTYAGLAAVPSPHVFAVRAKDLAGNVDPSPASYQWTVDPTVLDTSITMAPPTISGPTVSFEFTSTRTGTFECKLAPIDSAFSACTSPRSYTNLNDVNNPFTFHVRAVDAAQNVDASPATYQWTVDSTGPTVTILSPSGTTNAAPTLSFTVEQGAAYVCRIDNQAPFSCASGTAFAPLPAGPHVVYVTGTDSFGNKGPESSQSFTVDTAPPMFTSFMAPPEGGTSDPALSITYALSDGSVTACAIDGATPAGGCGSPVSLTGLLVGEHTFSITAQDAVGNTVTVSRGWVVPPVANYQALDMTLGQGGSLTSNVANLGGVSATSMSHTLGIATSTGGFWVSDADNCRILDWPQGAPIVDFGASRVFGQVDLSSSVCLDPSPAQPTDAYSISPTGGFACATATRLYVSDVNASRVLVWPLPAQGFPPAATLVLGQSGANAFTTKTQGDAADQLRGPLGLWCDDSRVIAADAGNNRVLIWNSPPTVNGQPADVVLGWTDFGMGYPASPASATSLNTPFHAHFDGTHLYVADWGNHRIMVWNGIPSTNGAPADLVLGQTGFSGANPGAGRAGVNNPYGVLTYKNSLFAIDRGNNRVVVWTPIPTSSAENAKAVLGAPDLDTAASTMGSDRVFFGPRAMTIANGKLWVTDGNRVVRFSLRD